MSYKNATIRLRSHDIRRGRHGNPDSYQERRPDKHRSLRQLLNSEQEDERSVATDDASSTTAG